MAENDFQPEKRTIEDLFVGPDYFLIPRFQRPYSWDQANLDDFWRDVIYDNESGYFIGPMVAWRDRLSSISRVVDGQQRLTTIAILFAVLRDEFDELGEVNLATGIHRYLEKANRNNEKEYTLQTESESGYLYNGIFLEHPDKKLTPQTDEDDALYHAAGQLRKLVNDEVERNSSPVAWLTNVRNRLLSLRVIWVEHGNEDDAYIIFETLNSRGKDLEPVDLLKNLLFNKLRSAGNRRSDQPRDQWNEMRAVIEGTSNPSLDVNRFILHWWLSQEPYVAQRKLFRAIKTKIRTKNNAKARLDSLSSDVIHYREALDPSSHRWGPEEGDARRSLEALAEFRISQPAPLLLSLMRARFGSAAAKLRVSQFTATLQTIERYHFQFTVVSQLSSSGGVSEMYAKAARDLFASKTPQVQADVLKDIRQKLVDRAPTRDQFVSDFVNRFVVTDTFTRDNRVVKYVLRAILRHLHPTTNLEDLTIEHILPQDQIGQSGIGETLVGNIGNLILVSDSLNSRLDNKPFPDKQAILRTGGAAYDLGGVLKGVTVWTQPEIVARAKNLAELAYDTVWRLPV
jgi:hypothetical protein